jgi:hypothetical protein
MPFITRQQFEAYCSTQMFSVLEHNATAFEQAEIGASQTVTRITSVLPPTDALDAPAWVLQPMCWLVNDIMIDSLPNVDENHIQRARDNRKKAIEELEGWKKGYAPPVTGAAATGVSENALW